MRVVFLDIDGVLNCESDLFYGIMINKDSVGRVNLLCRNHKAKIVISSSWRNLYRLNDIRMMLKDHGMDNNIIIDQTPVLNGTRGQEIEKWIDNRGDIDGYVILDDDGDFLDYQLPFLVKTSFKLGFTEDKLEEANKVLSITLKRKFL